MTSAVNGPAPGSWVSTLTRGAGPGTLADLPVEPAGPGLGRAGQRQAVPGHLAGGGGQRQRGQPVPARPAPAPGRPAIAVVGQHGVDPVSQQRPQLAHRGRRDPAPPAAGPRAAAAPKSRRRPLSFFNRAEAIALHRSGCTRCASKP